MENKKYCVFCGQENNYEVHICSKCGKELDPKENLFKEYLLNKTKEKLKGDIEDSILNIILNFIKSHLYGFILTVSIICVCVVNVLGNESYIRKVTEEPTIPITSTVNYSQEQLAIKGVIDNYFNYARNNDVVALEKLKSPEIEIYNEAGRPVTRYYDVEGIGEVDSATYEYSLIDPDSNRSHTTVTQAFYDKGYTIGEVLVYETTEINGETEKQLYLITLSYIDNAWYINEATAMDIPEEKDTYVQDYLWLIGEMTLVDFNKDYLLPEEFGYQFENDIKSNLNNSAQYSLDWPVFELKKETDATRELSAKGYKLAQTIVYESENQYVITFVNIDVMWYVAEIVGYAG